MTGHKKGVLREVKTVPRNGFETRIQLDVSVEKVLVMAVGGVGDGRRSDIKTVVERC
jgi:hypothetical protein